MGTENMTAVSFQITKIVTDKFATYGDVIPDHTGLSFFAGVDYQINKDDRTIRCIFEFGVTSHQKTFIEISVSVYYRVQQESWDNLPLASGRKEFPPGFASHLALSSMATARGILHAKTEGSTFNQYFVPDLNTDGLIQRRLSVE